MPDLPTKVVAKLRDFPTAVGTLVRQKLLAHPRATERDMLDAIAYARIKAANAVADFLDARDNARQAAWPTRERSDSIRRGPALEGNRAITVRQPLKDASRAEVTQSAGDA